MSVDLIDVFGDTFEINNDGLFLADIDLDDNSGIKHVLDVVHQILILTQQLNPEYLLI